MRNSAFFATLGLAALASTAHAAPVAVYAAPPSVDLAQAVTAAAPFDPSSVAGGPEVRGQTPLTPSPAIVPEPTAWTYLVTGFIWVGGGVRARRLARRRRAVN